MAKLVVKSTLVVVVVTMIAFSLLDSDSVLPAAGADGHNSQVQLAGIFSDKLVVRNACLLVK